jgi:hypothetical protein
VHGTVVTGTPFGSGTTWRTIPITSVTTQGNVTVGVANFGTFNVTTPPQPVAIFKDTTPPVEDVMFTAIHIDTKK